MLQKYIDWDLYRSINCWFNHSKTTLLILYTCTFLVCSKLYNPCEVVILPTQCFNDPYIDKVLDSLRYEESSNGKRLLNINYKNGKEVSRDEGPYQLNSKNTILFSNLYNDSRKINPYNNETARRVARQIIIDNYRYTGNMFSAITAYNCGITGWIKGAPYKSYQFAERILRRIK